MKSRNDFKKSGEYEAIQLLVNEMLLRMADFMLEGDYIDALGEGIGYFYGLEYETSYDFVPSREILFLGWFLFDCFDDNGRFVVDDYIDIFADILRHEEMRVCYGLKETYMTCLKITKRTNQVYFLKDIFLGDEIVIPVEYFGDVAIPKGYLLCTRVMKLVNEFFLVGAGIVIGKNQAKDLAEHMHERFKDFCDTEEKMSFKDFLKTNGELLHWWIKGVDVEI